MRHYHVCNPTFTYVTRFATVYITLPSTGKHDLSKRFISRKVGLFMYYAICEVLRAFYGAEKSKSGKNPFYISEALNTLRKDTVYIL